MREIQNGRIFQTFVSLVQKYEKENKYFLFFSAQQVLEMVVWKRNLKCCAKFVVTKPAGNIMEWHHVTAAEDFSKGALEDWQQCKSNTLIQTFAFVMS